MQPFSAIRSFLCVAALGLLASSTFADQPEAPLDSQPTPSVERQAIEDRVTAGRARLVRLDLPLLGDDDTRSQQRIERAAEQLVAEAITDERPLLVIEFRVGENRAATPFERALGLARFLVDDRMAGVRSVAFVPDTLTGHAVLIALACEEIAIAPDAEIGAAAAGDDASRRVEPGVRAMYEQIATTRQKAPRAAVLAMIDREAELLRSETDRGVRLVLRSELAELESESLLGDQEVLSPVGVLARFTGREARSEGVAQYLARDRAALSRALGLSSGDLLEDRSLAEPWRPVMIDIAGPLTAPLVRRLKTLLADEIAPGRANWVGFRIDSLGGDPVAGVQLAQTIAELDDAEVRTVAYVPRRAEGPAALVALACDQLVMQTGAELAGTPPKDVGPIARRPRPALPAADAEEGPEGNDAESEEAQADENDAAQEPAAEGAKDPDARPLGAARPADPLEDDTLNAVLATLKGSLAEETGRSWSLLAATVDPRLEVIRYTHRETGEERNMSPDELAEQADPAEWRAGETVVAAGEPLRLEVSDAVRSGLAWREVGRFDDLMPLYGFESLPPTAEPNWALELVEALATPSLAALLLVIGVVGLYIELSTPGLGLGGFIASVAFLLFFWSKFLNGTADWLEALLFVAGVVFVLIEVVVLPGFGVFGLGGGLMILAALVLAGQTFVIPKTPTQLEELRVSLSAVAGAGVGCLVAGLVLRQYLPQSPFFRRAMLMPPEEADRLEQQRREALADYTHLVGEQGVAAGDLLPGGRAEIHGELVDVIAQGEIIEKGDAVEVVSARGSRVVVRRVIG